MRLRSWLVWLSLLATLGVALPAVAQPSETTAAPDRATAPDSAALAQANGEELSWSERAREFAETELLPVGKTVLFALLLFLVGWIIAKLISWVMYRLLLKTSVDDILAEKLGIKYLMESEGAPSNRVERVTASIIYYLLMLLVIVAVLQYVGLTEAAGPIQSFVDRVAESLPLIGKAVLILLVAYFAGRILQKVVTAALERAKLDDKFAELSGPEETEASKAGAEAAEEATPRKFSDTAGLVVFWLVMVGGLAGAVDALQIGPLAHASQNMLDRIIGLLPAIAIAAALLFAGWVFGKIARSIIDNVLDTAGLNRLVAKLKIDRLFGETRPSAVVGIVAQVFIVLQAVIAALNELDLETLSVPLTSMMTRFWYFLPVLAVSALIVIAGVVAARLVRNLVENLLENFEFDRYMGKIGFGTVERDDEVIHPRHFVGLVVQVAIVLVALVQALMNVYLYTWAAYVDAFIEYSITHVAVALLIVTVALAVGNYVRDIIASRKRDDSDDTVGYIAEFARYAVLVFGFTMAIHHLDIGPYFVLVSFSLLFGSLCLALALALGLGGREVAGDFLKRQYDRAQREVRERQRTQPKPPTGDPSKPPGA